MKNSTQSKSVVKFDKIGSVLKNLNLSVKAELSPHIIAKDGETIAVRALSRRKVYGELELTTGRMSKVRRGDIIAGALGARKASEGIVGIVPEKIRAGDTLELLNIGGVIGKAVSWNKDMLRLPLQVEVLGSVLVDGKTVNLHDISLPLQTTMLRSAPLVVVMGTAMNTGKTTVVTEVIRILAKKKKLNVAAAKLTGVAAQKDILAMKDAGAKITMTFMDVGFTSTINNKGRVVSATKTILNTLNQERPDVIVAELGDGIIGWYGIDKLLRDQEFRKAIAFTIFCAHDLVGAEGGYKTLKRLGVAVDFFAGHVANNTAGSDYLEQVLGVSAQDVRESREKLLVTLSKNRRLRCLMKS